jgi:diguanylate cyclase (GGDEF)-like protein
LYSSFLSLSAVVDSNVLTVTPATPFAEIINLINHNGSILETTELQQAQDNYSVINRGKDCILVANDRELLGIITEREIVRFISNTIEVGEALAVDVMAPPVATIKESDFRNVFSILDICDRNQINVVPVLSDRGTLVGAATLERVLQVLEPSGLLKHRSVAEFMTTNVIAAKPTISLPAVARLMIKRGVSYLVISDDEPIGTIAAPEMMQALTLGRDLRTISASEVMNTHITPLDRDDSLWHAHQTMQRLGIRQLGVGNRHQKLIGVMPQLAILEIFNPGTLYGFIENLQQQIGTLKREKLELLQSLNKNGEASALESVSGPQEETERDYLLALISMRMRQSLDLEEILETAALEIRTWLLADRVFIYLCDPSWNGIVSIESVSTIQWSLLGIDIRNEYFEKITTDTLIRGNAIAVGDIYTAGLERSDIEFLERFQVKSHMIVPISRGATLWGMLVIHHCAEMRQWQAAEIDFLERFSPQLAIAIHQSSLLEQSQVELAERKLAEAQLLHNAFHDSLTNLPNRALFMDRLGHAVERTKHHHSHLFAVLFIDIDRFKVVNDGLGHTIGDQLLIAIAQRLQTCLFSSDTFARLGGDEFTILLEDISDNNAAIIIANHIQQVLLQPFILNGYEVFTSASIGIVTSSSGYDEAESVLRDADTAMYRAKARGKAQYVVFEPDMYAGAITRLQSESDMRRALERNEFRLFYQPIMSLATKRITGFEALLRWHHPERGFIFPIDFIGLAEETGLIIVIGEWVLREACRQLAKWQVELPIDPPLTVSVNISSLQVTHTSFLGLVEQILQETGLSPHCLKLEITESTIMDNMAIACSKFEQLREQGVQVYIDDFGTGYSSFKYLQDLPIDVLKIDQSFISKIATDDNSLEIVRSIMALAHSIGMGVVAEGVETSEQLACLEAMGQESVQGYFISRPVDNLVAEQIIQELQASA